MKEIFNNHLDFIEEITEKTLEHYINKELNEIQKFCIGLLERLNFSCKSISLLLDKILEEPKHEYSLGVIIRASILDCLITMNVYGIILKSKNKKEKKEVLDLKITNFCKNILSDGLDNAFKHLENLKKNNFINEEQLKTIFNDIAINAGMLIEYHSGDGSKPVPKYTKKYRPKYLFDELNNTVELKKIGTFLYDSYSYFSKYDHFGFFYFQLKSDDLTKKTTIYKNAIENLVAIMSLLVNLLAEYSKNNNSIIKLAEKTDQYLSGKIVATWK